MSKKRIYVAIPYSDKSQKVMKYRYDMANLVSAHLILTGHIVFSPISHSHPISFAASQNIQTLGDLWYEQDLTFIEHWATNLYVVCVDGWRESVGVRLEIQKAKSLGIPVYYFHPIKHNMIVEV